ADRLGVDSRQDIRPAVTVAAGAGALLAAQAAWVRGGRPDALPERVVEAFDALAETAKEARAAGAEATEEAAETEATP
ncbi:TetR family transcriptional regulator, partial [Streptomyces sp. BF-3]